MKGVLWIVLLALAWAAVNGEFSGGQLAVGLVLGTLVLVYFRTTGVDYLRKAGLVVGFAAFVVEEIVRANLRVAWDVLSPRPRIAPGVIALPLDIEGDVALTAMIHLVSLTPGTLSLDISRDEKVLYFHTMYAADVEKLRQETKDGYERRIQELFS